MPGLETLLLQRRANQSITSSTDTAVSWDTEQANTGPSSWWSAGSPTLIVMPYSGTYLMTVHVTWTANVTGIRAFHWHRGSGAISSANFEYNQSIVSSSLEEETAYIQLTQHIEVPAPDTFQAVVWQNSGGALNISTRIGTVYPATLSLSYLG